MRNQTNKTTIKSYVKSAIDNIDFNWIDVDYPNKVDVIYETCFGVTPFGYYTIKKFDYQTLYRLYLNDRAISNDVDDIDYLKKLALKDYKNKLSKAFDL